MCDGKQQQKEQQQQAECLQVLVSSGTVSDFYRLAKSCARHAYTDLATSM